MNIINCGPIVKTPPQKKLLQIKARSKHPSLALISKNVPRDIFQDKHEPLVCEKFFIKSATVYAKIFNQIEISC